MVEGLAGECPSILPPLGLREGGTPNERPGRITSCAPILMVALASSHTAQPSVDSARAAIHLLTSSPPESGRQLALLGILTGLYVAYGQEREGAPAWLGVLMEESAASAL